MDIQQWHFNELIKILQFLWIWVNLDITPLPLVAEYEISRCDKDMNLFHLLLWFKFITLELISIHKFLLVSLFNF